MAHANDCCCGRCPEDALIAALRAKLADAEQTNRFANDLLAQATERAEKAEVKLAEKESLIEPLRERVVELERAVAFVRFLAIRELAEPRGNEGVLREISERASGQGPTVASVVLDALFAERDSLREELAERSQENADLRIKNGEYMQMAAGMRAESERLDWILDRMDDLDLAGMTAMDGKFVGTGEINRHDIDAARKEQPNAH
jgi:hypothetical protein